MRAMVADADLEQVIRGFQGISMVLKPAGKGGRVS